MQKIIALNLLALNHSEKISSHLQIKHRYPGLKSILLFGFLGFQKVYSQKTESSMAEQLQLCAYDMTAKLKALPAIPENHMVFCLYEDMWQIYQMHALNPPNYPPENDILKIGWYSQRSCYDDALNRPLMSVTKNPDYPDQKSRCVIANCEDLKAGALNDGATVPDPITGCPADTKEMKAFISHDTPTRPDFHWISRKGDGPWIQKFRAYPSILVTEEPPHASGIGKPDVTVVTFDQQKRIKQLGIISSYFYSESCNFTLCSLPGPTIEDYFLNDNSSAMT